jgi:hypothetical protein
LYSETAPISPRNGSTVFHIPDLNLVQASVLALLKVDVDWEMGVDVAHLVLVALGNTNDEVVDQGSDCSEGSDILSCAVVELDVDDAGGGMRERDGKMAQVLCEFACHRYELVKLSQGVCNRCAGGLRTSWALNRDESGFDLDFHALWNGQGLLRVDVLHLARIVVVFEA